MKVLSIRFVGLFFLSLSLLCSCVHKPPAVSTIYADGMRRSIPEKQSVATESLVRFLDAVGEQELELHSFMMLRNGLVIAEGYWDPYKRDINHIMHSASKTFTSTAIGFAVTEGLLTVDDKVVSFFPDDLPETVSPYLAQMTVKDLLTMTAGHAEAPVFTMDDANWVKSFLAVPIINEPGTRFQYSSYASYMLSAIITKVTGESTMDYLSPRLFEPLRIKDIQWETGQQGFSAGGWGLRIKTSDMAKLGQFYLQKGVWHDKQLLPKSWIEEATMPHIYQQPNRSEEENAMDEGAQGYGYQLWRCTHGTYRMDGANGQFILVIPDKNAVIITTARVEDAHQILRLIWEHIYPGIMDRPRFSDEAENDRLISTLSSLKTKDPFRTPDEMTILRNETRVYQIEPNEEGLQTISFRWDEEGGCDVTLGMASASYVFPAGHDTWKYGETDRPGSYFRNLRRNPDGMAPFLTAGYSSWTKTDEFSVRLLYMTDMQYETYVCSFDEDKVSIQFTHSMNPKGEPLVLKGTRQ